MQRINLIMTIAIGALATADRLGSAVFARDRRNHAGPDGPESVNMTLTNEEMLWDSWEWAKAVPPCADTEVQFQLPTTAQHIR